MPKQFTLTLIILFSLTLTACGLLQPDDKVANYRVSYRSQLEPQGYYAQVALNDHTWQLQQISEQPLAVEKANQEVLFISPDYRIQPVYQSAEFTNATEFVCRDLKTGKLANYMPCNSQLVVLNTGFRLTKALLEKTVTLGLSNDENHSTTGELDLDKFAIMIQQSQLLQKIQDYQRQQSALQQQKNESCQRYLDHLASLSDRIKLQAQIQDNSGFYQNENLLRLIVPSQDCPETSDKNKWHYQVKLAPAYFTAFEFTIHPERYELPHQPDYLIQPVLTIHYKTFQRLYPSKSFADDNLAIGMKEINAHSGRIRFQIQFTNQSNHYLTIESISLYLNQAILTQTFTQTITLPPHSKTGVQELMFEQQSQADYQIAYHLIQRKTTLNQSNISLDIGLSVQYKLDNDYQTLYQKQTFIYGELVQ